MNKISQIRRDYSKSELLESNIAENPLEQFKIWFDEALKANFTDPSAFILSTSTFDGKPSSRVVLLKEYSENGFVFFTNYQSKKGQNILENPFVSLLFFWDKLERQVRIEGEAIQISEVESNEYFQSRPYESKIGAWASKQSHRVNNRNDIEKRFDSYKSKYHEQVPLPEFWGGYLVKVNYFEFWQGRSSRLHDRIVYELVQNIWNNYRLYP